MKLNKILLIVAFIAIGFGLMQVPFTKLVGAVGIESDVKFSLFDFYGPIIGGFLGSVWGLLTVFAMQLVNWAYQGFAVDTATIIRFFPMLFAVLYFVKKSRSVLLVPVLAMLVFWAHPEGQKAWYFALYWLIPIACYFFYNKWTFARALGSTFTQHAVGGALWIWAFDTPAAVWTGIIFPLVWKERLLMALGITLTYLVFNWAFNFAIKHGWLKLSFLKLHRHKS
jgi:hypothetical protein